MKQKHKKDERLVVPLAFVWVRTACRLGVCAHMCSLVWGFAFKSGRGVCGKNCTLVHYHCGYICLVFWVLDFIDHLEMVVVPLLFVNGERHI